MAQARHLHPRAAVEVGGLQAALRVGRDQPRLADAGRRPGANHRVGAAGGRQAALVHFQRQGGDVFVGQGVGRGIDQGRIGDDRQRCVHAVEDGAQVDGKRVLALADKDLGRHRAAGQGDAVDVLSGIGRVVGNGLGADVVDRLVETGGPAAGVGGARLGAGASVATHHVERVAFTDIQVGVLDAADHAGLHKGQGHGLAVDVAAGALQIVLETELEGEVFFGIADVVDMDLVQRVRVHREVVRATVRVLQRLVVGDQGHVVGAARLVAHEHVEVGRVHFGLGGDERCFAVAGGHGDRRDSDGCQRQCAATE